jgi:hypothetical protein
MGAVAAFLAETFGIPAESHTPPRVDRRDTDACRVRNMFRPPEQWEDCNAGDIPLYDGYMLADQLGNLLSHDAGAFHVLFVDDAIGTYDHADMRYHGRALISANPCIVSVRGMCEAPARSREYCIDVMACAAAGGDEREVELRYGGQFLTYDDSRLQEVSHGYVMQAVFHFETGEAFCADADCRLYNSHWQSDVIRTQVVSPRLCGRHQDVLRRIAARRLSA